MKQIDMIHTQSAAQSLVSAPISAVDVPVVNIDVDFTGGAGNLVGTLTLEFAADGVNYKTVDNSSLSVTASAGQGYNYQTPGIKYLRLRWVYTSGTGNITATATINQWFVEIRNQ